MGIRIPWAFTPQRERIAASAVDPEARCDHYLCPKCKVKLAFNKAYDKNAGEDVIHVAAYFKLWPKAVHLLTCPFNLTEQFKVIAAISKEAGEYLKKEPNASRYSFRLMALPNSGQADVAPEGDALPAKPPRARNPEFQLSDEQLPAYLSTAKRIFELRSLCEGNAGFEEALVLTYEGRTIPWSEVCFEQDEFLEAHAAVKAANGETHPMALIGKVKGIFETTRGDKTFHVLAMEPFRSRRSSEGIVTSVEPRVSTSQRFYLKGLSKGDILIAFGHWNPFQAADGEDKERGTTFKNHILYLNPRRKDQIAKAPKGP